MSLRFVFTKGIAMDKPAILNDQKYHEVLENSEILHTQSKLQGEIFKLAKFLKSSKQR